MDYKKHHGNDIDQFQNRRFKRQRDWLKQEVRKEIQMQQIESQYVLSKEEIEKISQETFYDHEDADIIKETFKGLADK